MSIDVSKLVQLCTEISRYTAGEQPRRTLMTTMALSRALAYVLPLPSSPVDNVQSYWLMNSNRLVADTLSAINERNVIDVAQIAETTYAIWCLRYKMVFEPTVGTGQALFDAVILETRNESLREPYRAVAEEEVARSLKWNTRDFFDELKKTLFPSDIKKDNL
jgi:hypothetical protein